MIFSRHSNKNGFQPFGLVPPAGYADHNPSKCTQVECVRVNLLHGIAVNDSQPFVNPSLWLSNPLKKTQPTESVGKEDIMSKRTFAFQPDPYKIQLLTLFFIHFTGEIGFPSLLNSRNGHSKERRSATENQCNTSGFSHCNFPIQLESVLHSKLKCKNIYHQVRSRIVIRPH